MKRIRRFGVFQTSLHIAVTYFFISLIVMVPIFIFGASLFEEEFGMDGMGNISLIFIPFAYAIIGFIVSVIACAVYNLVARWTGGVEMEFTDNTPAPYSDTDNPS